MAAASLETVDVAGRRLAWRRLGSGPRLLLVNGYAATGADWDPSFLELLGASREVICPDNRGVGASERGEGISIDAMAADLGLVLDALGEERIPVFGWSMGGFVAQRFAELAPERVAALGMISTDPGGAAAVLGEAAVWWRLTDHGGSPREQASRLISLLFPAPLAAEVDREFGEVVAAARAELSAASLRDQEAAMLAWHELETAAPAEPPPSVVVHGNEDAVIPAANAELLAARWAADRVQVIDGCAHAVMAQEPAAVAAALLSVDPR